MRFGEMGLRLMWVGLGICDFLGKTGGNREKMHHTARHWMGCTWLPISVRVIFGSCSGSFSPGRKVNPFFIM